MKYSWSSMTCIDAGASLNFAYKLDTSYEQ